MFLRCCCCYKYLLLSSSPTLKLSELNGGNWMEDVLEPWKMSQHLPHQHFLIFSWHRLVSSLPCHYFSIWLQKGLVWKITQVWNITGFTSRLFDDLAEYSRDLFFTVSMWSVWGRQSPQHSTCVCVCVCVCVCSLLRHSPHCPVYRNNSVMLLVIESTPNSQRQSTLSASKPSQQLTSRKTALSTQNSTKVALSKPKEFEVNISTIDSG